MSTESVNQPATVDEIRESDAAVPVADQSQDITASENYLNRELSQLAFNYRVLKQALDPTHPLINRLIFCCIFSSNMDEFFEIRVAGLRQQMKYGREKYRRHDAGAGAVGNQPGCP